MSELLARFAESAFWMARYMERTENLARVIDVTETFARDRHNAEQWLPIVEINSDTPRFLASRGRATAGAVIDFYVLDLDNPTSIISSVRMARENARILRHLISTEMWTHLNVFYNDLAELAPADLKLSDLSRLCMIVKEHCQTHTGITEGTLYRDQAWSFHELGKYLERADQTTRLLDIKYHRLLPSPDLVGSAIDAGEWNALLRSASGYHAYRRGHPRGMQPARVVDFLMFNRSFPRSVSVCVRQASDIMSELVADYELERGAVVVRSLRALRDALAARNADGAPETGLHEFLDSVQCRIVGITGDLSENLFGHGE